MHIPSYMLCICLNALKVKRLKAKSAKAYRVILAHSFHEIEMLPSKRLRLEIMRLHLVCQSGRRARLCLSTRMFL